MYCNLQGILEALEFKLKNGWKPERTFYIAFGHDEEVIYNITFIWFGSQEGWISLLNCVAIFCDYEAVLSHFITLLFNEKSCVNVL